jgi:hypothetical protein
MSIPSHATILAELTYEYTQESVILLGEDRARIEGQSVTHDTADDGRTGRPHPSGELIRRVRLDRQQSRGERLPREAAAADRRPSLS